MINQGKFRDNTNFIKFAGKTTKLTGDNAMNCIKGDLNQIENQINKMPKNQYKFSNTLREIPGKKQLHHGYYNDPKDHEDLIHGKKTAVSEHTSDCIYGTKLNGVKYFMNEMKEKQYLRSRKEPLGKTMERNYIFPQEAQSDGFKFGVPTRGMENLKEILYTCPNINETDETKRMYRTTHGLTDPGEQKNRNYNWSVDKNRHAFGKPQEKEYNGAKKSLMTDFLESEYPKTKVVTKRLEDYRKATEEGLGRTKYRGTVDPNLGEDFTFGVPSIKNVRDQWNLMKCLQGDLNNPNVPDSDLGKTILHRSKLSSRQPKEYNPNRTFGVPSVRDDLPKKRNVSVNDLINYGDDRPVFELLYPNPHVFKGIDNEDFTKLITKEELRKILEENSYKFSDDEFQVICQIVLANKPNEEEKISYKSFVEVMRKLKRDYVKFRGMLK